MKFSTVIQLWLFVSCVHGYFGKIEVPAENYAAQQSCIRPMTNLPYTCGGIQDSICSVWETVSDPERLEKYRTFESYKVYCTLYANQFPSSLEVELSVQRDPKEDNINEEIVVKKFSKFHPTNLPEMYFSVLFNFPEISSPDGKACIKVQVKDKQTQELVSCQFGCFHSKD